jgi:PAS domain S-box-containing protein
MDNKGLKDIFKFKKNAPAKKQLPLSLEEINQRYNYVSKATLDAIWDWDLIEGTFYRGDGYENVFGHKSQDLLPDVSSLAVNIHPEDVDKVIKSICDVTDSKESNWCYEYRYLKADGTYAYVIDKGFVIRDDNGKAIRMVGVMQDISLSKKTEQELNQIFNFAPDIICIATKDGYFKKINPAACNLLEYSEEELLKQPFRNFVHPDDLNKTAQLLNDLNNGKPTYYFENRYITKSGKIKWLTWTSSALDEQENIFAVAKDVTEHKNTQNLLDRAISLSKTGGWEVNLVKEIITWSEMTRKIHEVDEDFIPDNKNALSFFKDDQNKEAISNLFKEAIHNGEKWDDELQIITAKGNELWIRVIGEPEFKDGKCVRLFGSFQDIDVRKRAELTASQALHEKSNILESIGDGFYAVDKNWVITYWNNQAGKITGKPKDEVIGKNLWEVLEIGSDSTLYINFHKAAAENTDVHFESEYKVANKWLEKSAYPSPNGITIYFKDITVRKQYEIRLNELNEELKMSNTELEQFAYVASHDLQEPLRMITSFLTQLEKKYNDVIDEKGRKYIYFAVDGAKRMRKLILDLLEFSRVGKTNNKPEQIDLNEVLDEIKILYQKKIDESNAVIHVGKLPTIMSERTQIAQVFQNLISNALKYHKSDVVPIIEIKCEEDTEKWQFEIKDNGIGIDAEYFDKIFIIFQRLHNKDAFSGTGIGLSITKKFIENMGGKIWVKSEEGYGSSFYFTIKK